MTECKEWPGPYINPNVPQKRYGRLKGHYPRPDGSEGLVHRRTWVEHHGPIPDGMVIRHRCDNTICYEITHLEIGTQRQNMQDMMDRGRHGNVKKTHCAQGHEFTEENTYVRKDRPGRECRKCRAGATSKYRG